MGPRAHPGGGVLRVDQGQDFGALAAAQWEILSHVVFVFGRWWRLACPQTAVGLDLGVFEK